ncbi:MAG: hypothetical protein EZS28_007165 [Streblomastix strix]|uniref:RRM domain-containing protein n=1 Tax=Streblomastix strix TaxID=222440 RepID=A0A5J4WT67_9EUKA|nr:MAG: hypothetical protein EZS28_007165 [Streblomastix strix]
MADSISQSKYQLCLQCSGLLTEHKKEDLTKFLNQFGKFKTLEYDDKAQEPRTAFIFFDSLSTMDNILAKANGKKLGKNGTIILKPKQAVWIEQIVNELQTAEKDENIEKEKLKEQINLNNKNTIKAKTIPKDGLQIKDQNSETGTLKSNEDVRLKKGVDMIERGILKEIESILHNISINNNIVKLNEKEKLKLNEQDQGLLCPTLQAVQEVIQNIGEGVISVAQAWQQYSNSNKSTLVLLLNHSNVEIAEKSSLLLLTFSQVSHLQFNRKELEKTKTTDQIFQNGVINGKSDTIKVSAALILCQIYSNKINQISEYDDNLNNNKSNGEKQKNYLEKMKQEEEIKKSKIPVDQRDEIVKKLKQRKAKTRKKIFLRVKRIILFCWHFFLTLLIHHSSFD